MNEITLPPGFMCDAKGNLVALSNIKAIDLIRDELVGKLSGLAIKQQAQMRAFKTSMLNELESFVSLSADEYQLKLGGKKGNITLLNFNSTLKIQIAISDQLQFDERLQVAKQLIDECIHDWSNGANDRIRTLVEHAFQVDKEGQVSTARILGLRRLDMEDERWDRAMKAIADSIQVTDSKSYIRFYKRSDTENAWQAISLDIAAL
ncbi:DUF3164 family protein [Shewanella sp. D64]|uniref:DUF3164 family protein n=1 Tax=unclassified Shewanella TaxID=196818 RepID=UPI0022BA30DE|nr:MULTISPECIES: DUF3164 family protein [unclassified Shewanella]MEC4724549.1 DUF3164 family protein [Shewanella sp. D64]MEC4736674.1 DUF3164 family protein [Shewanella sp. E94]WBJ94656.1 DUF3164 family protein [Shewanella sp. MTB7]